MGGYSHTSEPVRFERDCEVVMVPSGEVVNLPAGSAGYITQALGGSFTVYVEGNLFRIAGRDGDAIGLWRLSFNRFELERRDGRWQIARRTTRMLGHDEAHGLFRRGLHEP